MGGDKSKGLIGQKEGICSYRMVEKKNEADRLKEDQKKKELKRG